MFIGRTRRALIIPKQKFASEERLYNIKKLRSFIKLMN